MEKVKANDGVAQAVRNAPVADAARGAVAGKQEVNAKRYPESVWLGGQDLKLEEPVKQLLCDRKDIFYKNDANSVHARFVLREREMCDFRGNHVGRIDFDEGHDFVIQIDVYQNYQLGALGSGVSVFEFRVGRLRVDGIDLNIDAHSYQIGVVLPSDPESIVKVCEKLGKSAEKIASAYNKIRSLKEKLPRAFSKVFEEEIYKKKREGDQYL